MPPLRRPRRPRELAPSTLLLVALTLAACAAHPSAAASTSHHHGLRHSSTTSTTTSTSTSTTTTSTTVAVTPVNGKVTVLEVGDSLGIDLGWGMQWALGADPHVNLVQDARGDTGLANTGYYNWPAELSTELQANHPQIVVVFLGANDVQGFYVGSQVVTFGTPAWRQAYAARVATMMSEATAAGAKVLWVGMPIMQDPTFSSAMREVDAIYRAEAAVHPGVTYMSSWRLFSTPTGQYNGGTTDVAGSVMPLRDPDGIHLADGGEDLLGLAVVKEMRTLYHLP
ncbi:MAG TPA: DUF459 domain-containing protein [Acidimicrobiales bacterium]|nr:DUF459 domain-containing protein [Acidimicrobiales bacterium]